MGCFKGASQTGAMGDDSAENSTSFEALLRHPPSYSSDEDVHSKKETAGKWTTSHSKELL